MSRDLMLLLLSYIMFQLFSIGVFSKYVINVNIIKYSTYQELHCLSYRKKMTRRIKRKIKKTKRRIKKRKTKIKRRTKMRYYYFFFGHKNDFYLIGVPAAGTGLRMCLYCG